MDIQETWDNLKRPPYPSCNTCKYMQQSKICWYDTIPTDGGSYECLSSGIPYMKWIWNGQF